MALPTLDTLTIAAVSAWAYLRHPQLVLQIRNEFGRWPNPALPRRQVDKYLWRRLFDHNPAWTPLVDKITARDEAQKRCPEVKVAKLLWTGTDPEAIPESLLAGNVVIKSNNASGRNIFVRNGVYDRAELIRKGRMWMRKPFGRREAQWVYSTIAPKILVEEMIMDGDGPIANEFCVYVAHGEIGYTYAPIGPLKKRHAAAVFDPAGKSYELPLDSMPSSTIVPRPAQWDKLVSIAKKLCAGVDLVRCDVAISGEDIYFAEYTFYSRAGRCWIGSPDLMAQTNQMFDLANTWFVTNHHKGWRDHYAQALRRVLPHVSDAPAEENVPRSVLD